MSWADGGILAFWITWGVAIGCLPLFIGGRR
ncbi:MAG: hypothetical protein JWO11_3593 [Nocardioides sp.]|nr:hypothetical protein [Nocardioides sp.]